MLSREVMICPRPRVVFSQTESSGKDKCSWEYQELKLHGGERKKGDIDASLFSNSNGWSPPICLSASQLSKVFVTLATTDPPCKALQEWSVTRHANRHCTGQEPPEAIVCPVKTCCQVFSALIPVLHPGIFPGFISGTSLRKQTTIATILTTLLSSLSLCKETFSLYKAQLG